MMTVNRKQQGFTLLEVLVVLAIIGGLMSMATFNASNNPALDKAKETARDLTFLLGAYREDAVFQNADYGIAMDGESMMLLRFEDPERTDPQQDSTPQNVQQITQQQKAKLNPWREYAHPRLKAEIALPEGMAYRLFVDGEEVDFDNLYDDELGFTPALEFSSSEEYTPFKLELTNRQDDSFAVILTGDGLGAILRQVENYED